jgi:hypothetical protein
MKLFASLFIIIISTIVANSQKYVPFNFDQGEWYCTYYTKGGMFGTNGTEWAIDSVKFYCSGDTVIKDTVYHKLYHSGTNTDYNSRAYISGYYGAVRNDTIKKQVWFNDGFGSYLMYDFNLSVGDSACNITYPPLPIYFDFCGKIESIDSTNYCNKYFRKYNNENNQSIVEGIGSYEGLFQCGFMPKLICYIEKDNNQCESCEFHITQVASVKDENIIQLNISDCNLHIVSKNNMESIELIDISGRSILNTNLNSDSIEIYVPQKGTYIIKVKSENQIYVRKIGLK